MARNQGACARFKACCSSPIGWQTLTVVISALSVIAGFAAIWSPWWTFATQQYQLATGLTTVRGQFFLWEARACATVSGPRASYENAVACTVVQVQDMASDASFLATAGVTALVLAAVSLPFGVIGFYLLYVRRLSSSWRVPTCLRYLRSAAAAPLLHLVQAALCAASIGAYYAQTRGSLADSYMGGSLANVVPVVSIFAPDVASQGMTSGLSWGYWAGLGLMAVSLILAFLAVVLGAVFSEEQPRVHPAFTAAGAAAAQQQQLAAGAARAPAPSMFQAEPGSGPADAGEGAAAAATPADSVKDWGATPAGPGTTGVAVQLNPLAASAAGASAAGEVTAVDVTLNTLPGTAAEGEEGRAPAV